MAKHSSSFAVYGAIVANLAVAISKFIAAFISGSSAMLSEGIHSTVDTGDSLLLLLGLHRSQAPPDEMHPFGHGKEIYFWSLIVAVIIFGVGGGMAIYEGISHLIHPTPLEDPTWNYIVLGAAAVFDGISLTIGLREFLKRKRPGESFWKAVFSSKDPSLFTVIFEDSSDLAGLASAFLGVLISHLFKLPMADAIASLVIGAVLITSASFLVYQCRGLLIGESADPEQVREIHCIAAEDPAVVRAAPPLTMQMGPQEVLLNLDVQFQTGLSSEELQHAIHRLETSIQQKYPEVRRIFIEAAAFRDGAPAG